MPSSIESTIMHSLQMIGTINHQTKKEEGVYICKLYICAFVGPAQL